MIQKNHKLVHHFLEESARIYPDKIALIHGDVRASYARINSEANQFAHWLLERKIGNGDRVVILSENSLIYVVSYYGILKAGAVACPLSPDLKPQGVEHFINELEPKVIISSSRVEKTLKEVDLGSFNIRYLVAQRSNPKISSSCCKVFTWRDLIGNEPSNDHSVPINVSSLASIIYTSGSTGKPKGAMLTHGNIVSNTLAICQYLELNEQDIQMAVLPFFYVMGKSTLNTHFAVGGTVVINNKFAFPASVVNQMVDEKVTGFSGVPSTYAFLIHRSPLLAYRERLESLRYCSQAGGHMPKQVKEELRRMLPEHTKLYIMYGATEATARLTFLEPERFLDKMDSIGRPIPGVTVRVLDTEGNEVPPSVIGELVASGPNIMQGYWKDEESTKKVLDRNGYHTGDMGFQDAEGYLYVVGRKDNILKIGGHKINPQEVEDVLMDTSLLIEVAVIGVPHELMGNNLIAFAVPKVENCSEGVLLNRCSEKLPRYKVPVKVRFVPSLPKNSNGKVDRDRCLELARA